MSSSQNIRYRAIIFRSQRSLTQTTSTNRSRPMWLAGVWRRLAAAIQERRLADPDLQLDKGPLMTRAIVLQGSSEHGGPERRCCGNRRGGRSGPKESARPAYRHWCHFFHDTTYVLTGQLQQDADGCRAFPRRTAVVVERVGRRAYPHFSRLPTLLRDFPRMVRIRRLACLPAAVLRLGPDAISDEATASLLLPRACTACLCCGTPAGYSPKRLYFNPTHAASESASPRSLGQHLAASDRKRRLARES